MPEHDTHKRNYERIAVAIHYLAERHKSQPTLSQLAEAVGLSKYHLQRLFSDWAGVTSKQFVQYLTKEYAKNQLRTQSVFNSALSSGLSGGGRLHDLMVTHESVTPGQYKSWGEGLDITFGVHPSRFGDCFVALTQRGVCKLAFIDSQEHYQSELSHLNTEWKNATIRLDQFETGKVVDSIFAKHTNTNRRLNLYLKGSPFQIQVWEALLKIPESRLASYQNIAEVMDKQSAVRAVATAVGQNPVGYLVPCHRVIRSTGVLGKYRWGETRKAVWEAASHLEPIKNSIQQ